MCDAWVQDRLDDRVTVLEKRGLRTLQRDAIIGARRERGLHSTDGWVLLEHHI